MRRTTIAAIAILGAGAPAAAQMASFGTDADQDYAARLWERMVSEGLAGPGAPLVFPYEGVEPHGFQLATLYTRAVIDGHDGVLVIKRNYGPEGVTADEVIEDPEGHLAAVTIMFRREAGYDAETGDWFYAKYLADGRIDVNPAGVALAGLVGKDGDSGCIACHQGAGGDDYLFTTDADLSAISMMPMK